MLLGACRLTFDRIRVALLAALFVVASFSLVACGNVGAPVTPSGAVTTRVLASQSVASPTAFPGLVIVDGEVDVLAIAAAISAGRAPGLMAISPNRTTLLAFDSSTNSAEVVNTARETQTGSIPLGGPTISMVALDTGFGYAAVPSASFAAGPSPGAVVVMNLGSPAGVQLPSASPTRKPSCQVRMELSFWFSAAIPDVAVVPSSIHCW